MTQEMRNTLVVTLAGLWFSFICAYGIITVGHAVIFGLGMLLGALLFIPGLGEILTWFKKED